MQNILNPLNAHIDLLFNGRGGGIWRCAIFFGLVSLVLSWAREINRRENNFAQYTAFIPLAVFFIVNCLFVLEFPLIPYGDFQTAYQASSGQALAEFLIFIFCIGFFDVEKILKIFQWVIVYEIIAVWLKWPGLMIPAPFAASFDTALMALYLPFAPVWLAIASILTIITHHGATALLIILVQFTAIAWQRFKPQYFFPAIFAAGGVFYALARYHQHSAMLDGTERLGLYAQHLSFWWNGTSPVSRIVWRLFGSGPGSFMWNSFLQSHFTPPLWPWLHNDFIQFMIENGIVGEILLLNFLGRVLWKVKRDPVLFPATLGICACALTYHPLRFFPSQLLTAIYFYLAMTKEKPQYL